MAGITNTRGYGIGAASAQTGVHIETIRYYERIGILPAPDRTAGGNRQYSHEHIKRLAFIHRSRGLGFSLKEIRSMLAMVDNAGLTCAEVHDMTASHLSEVQEKIRGLQRLEGALKDMMAECNRGDIPDCPIIDTLFTLPDDGPDRVRTR